MKTFTLFCIMTVFSQFNLILNAETFYVRPVKAGGYGTGTGTSYANAFNGSSGIVWGGNAGQVGSSDTLYVAGTHKETITVNYSGTSGGVITVSTCKTSYGASTEDPGIIDCGTSLTGWSDQGGGVYAITHGVPYFLMEDDKPLKYATSAACTDGNWYAGNGTLYYKPTSGTPANHTIQKPAYYTGVCLDNRSYITVEGLSIKKCFVAVRNITTASTGSSSNYITMKDCTVNLCREGYDSFANNSLDNAYITVQNNTFNYCARSIALYSSGDTGLEHQNSLVEENAINLPGYPYSGATYDWSAAVGYYIDQEGIGLQNVVDCTIQRNTISNGPATGIYLYVEQNSRVLDNVVQYNVVQCDRYGIMIGGHYAGDEITGNLIAYNLIKYCKAYSDSCGISLGNILNASSGWNYCYNNTVFNCQNGIVMTSHGNYWKVKNNILQSSVAYNVWAPGAYTTYPNREWDYNMYWWDGASRFNFRGTNYNFSGWQSITSGGANSFVDGADFVNGSSDFHLQSISPCINVGTPVGLTEDADGDSITGNPDIGYDEYTP